MEILLNRIIFKSSAVDYFHVFKYAIFKQF